ncbi:hypothetical protein ACFOHS_15805 [Jhaorihella thermophila]
MLAILELAARHGRMCLVLGLLAGLFLPGVAADLRPRLPQMVAFLLFLTAFRIGPRNAVAGLRALRRTAAMALILQLVLPLAAVAALLATGLASAPLGIAAVLMLAAPSVTGAPNFALLSGHDPAPALRLVVLGTALLPLTALPVFLTLPELGGLTPVLGGGGAAAGGDPRRDGGCLCAQAVAVSPADAPRHHGAGRRHGDRACGDRGGADVGDRAGLCRSTAGIAVLDDRGLCAEFRVPDRGL